MPIGAEDERGDAAERYAEIVARAASDERWLPRYTGCYVDHALSERYATYVVKREILLPRYIIERDDERDAAADDERHGYLEMMPRYATRYDDDG